MKKLNTKGFSAIEAFLILVIIAIIGGIGWFVYQAGHKKPAAQTSPTTASEQTSTKAKPTIDKLASVKERSLQASAKTSSWTLYEHKADSVSMRIPDGWQIATYKDPSAGFIAWCGSSPYWKNIDCITYKQDVKATITDQAYPTEGFAYLAFTAQPTIKSFPVQDEGEKVLEKLTTKSATIYKTEISYQVYSGQGEQDKTPAGTKYLSYYIKKGDKFFRLDYGIKPGEKDQSATVEDMLATFQ